MNGESDLPEGWEYGTIHEMVGQNGLFNDGDWIESKDQDPSGEVRLIQLADIKDGYFLDKSNRHLTLEKARELNCTFLQGGDLLIARMPDPIGRSCIFPEVSKKAVTAVDVCIVRTNPAEIDIKWLMYSINSPQIRELILEQSRGTTRKRISRKNLGKILFPLPPLAEQRRIVAAVEGLLSRVNASRERLDRVTGLLKAFRQAVLAAACSGRLTEGWRENSFLENNHYQEIPFGWKVVKVEEVCHSRLGKMLDKSKNRGEFVPYLRNINVRWFDFDYSDIKTIRATESEIENLTLIRGDLLVCEGGEPGRCAIWREADKSFIYQKALHRLRVKDNVIPEWICYCLKNAADSGRLSDLFTGSTIKHLTGVSLKEFSFPLPPLPEQHEIVRRVESLFALADRIEQRVAIGKERVDRLTQAILAKAFRGELVPTEAELARNEGRSYEPAKILLERVKGNRREK